MFWHNQDIMYDFHAQLKGTEVEVKFGINVIHNCYQKCTRSRAKRPERPALVYLLYIYVYLIMQMMGNLCICDECDEIVQCEPY